jgi:hypothetical protein
MNVWILWLTIHTIMVIHCNIHLKHCFSKPFAHKLFVLVYLVLKPLTKLHSSTSIVFIRGMQQYTRDVLIPVSRAYYLADFCGLRVNCSSIITEETGFVDVQGLPDICFCTSRAVPRPQNIKILKTPHVLVL